MDAGGGTRHLCPVVVTGLVLRHIYKFPPKRVPIPSFVGTTYLGNTKKRRDKKHVKSIRLVIVHLWPLSDVLIVTGEKRKKKKLLLSLASLLLSTSSEKHDVLPGLLCSHSLLFFLFGIRPESVSMTTIKKAVTFSFSLILSCIRFICQCH